MPTFFDMLKARRFSEAYLNRKFKDNQQFYDEVFEQWWYKSQQKKPLGEFLREKYNV